MEDDWDLHAVVRSCSSTTTTTTSTASSSTITAPTWSFSDHNQLKPPQVEYKTTNFFMGFPDLFKPARTTRSTNTCVEDLLIHPYKPTKLPFSPPPPPPPNSPLSVLGGLQDLSPPPPQQHQYYYQQQQLYLQKQRQPKQVFGGSRSATSQNARSKKRKNQLKRVCQVPAEALSSDMWSWRKYGQKPIKGSPYPRGYYRCSTSKGCLARKQVERNRSDPGMYILTYTGEHSHPMPTHRNSLAGSPRQKPTSSGDDGSKPNCSPPVSSSEENSPATEKREEREDMVEEDDEDDGFVVSDMALRDDFFEGLEELVGPVTGEYSSDHFPASLPFSLVV